MELSVDQKIKQALEPLLERIAALEAESHHFKQEIAGLQALAQHKNPHKPAPKPSFDHGQRPQTAKPNRKEQQQHQAKPDSKAIHKVGHKKQEQKVQHEEGKPIATKVTNISNKNVPSTTPLKDSNDPKSGKVRPTTATANKHPTANTSSKGAGNEKKSSIHKNNETDLQKKQQGQEDKKHVSHQKEHKTNSTHGIKSPATKQPKFTQKQPEKKLNVPPSPAPGNKKQPPPSQKPEPKAIKGGKPKPPQQPEVKEQKSKIVQAQVHVAEEEKLQSQLLQNVAQEGTLAKEVNGEQVKNEVAQKATAEKQQQAHQVGGEVPKEAVEVAANEASAQ